MYYCEDCKQPIQNLSDGLVLKIRDENGNFVKGLVLHSGECDDRVADLYRRQGKNANGTMTLDTLDASNDVERYRVTGELPN